MSSKESGPRLKLESTPEGMWLNGFVFDVDAVDLQVGILPVIGQESFRRVMEQRVRTHIMRRRGNTILNVPVNSEIEFLGGGSVRTLNLRENHDLAQEMIRHCIVEFLCGRGVQVVSYYRNIQFLGRDQFTERLERLGWEWFACRTMFELSVRRIETLRGVRLVILVNTAIRHYVTRPCTHLLKRGYSLLNMYVGELVRQHSDERLVGEVKLLGRVKCIEGDFIVLDDCRTGEDRIHIDSAWVDSRSVKPILAQKALSLAQRRMLDEIGVEEQRVSTPEYKEAKVRKLQERLGQCKFALNNGTVFGRIELIVDRALCVEQTKATTPQYEFSSCSRIMEWPLKGLMSYGPRQSMRLLSRRLNLAVMVQARHLKNAKNFIRGMVEASQGKNGELSDRLRLNGASVRYFEVASDDPQSYRVTSRQICDEQKIVLTKFDMVFVVIEEHFHQVRGDCNPYLVAKAMFLCAGIPSQAIENESIVGDRKGYVARNIMLQVFAKLGGVPWLLKSNNGEVHEVIVGLKQVIVQDGRFRSTRRSVGVAAMFTSEGRYLGAHHVSNINVINHEVAVAETLRESLRVVMVEQGWRQEDEVRLIVHTFKPWKSRYIDQLRAELKTVHVGLSKVTLVHVAENSEFLMFGRSRTTDGQDTLLPSRGSVVLLGRTHALLSTIGQADLVNKRGCPKPLSIEVHKASDFQDIRKIVEQVSHLTQNSFRTFGVNSLPVTMLYAQRMAKLLEDLADVKDWDPERLSLHDNANSLWFL